MIPTRIQRQRTKGWRMPENTLYVGRPTVWGNPVAWKELLEDGYDAKMARQVATEMFDDNLSMHDWEYPSAEVIERVLRDQNLACWCPLHHDCHADLLLELANGDRLPVGTPVLFWPGARVGEGRPSVTRTPIWKVGSGTEVVSVEGYPGGITLTHIQTLPVGETTTAKDPTP